MGLVAESDDRPRHDLEHCTTSAAKLVVHAYNAAASWTNKLLVRRRAPGASMDVGARFAEFDGTPHT